LKEKYLNILCCPECKSELLLSIKEISGDDVKTGTLKCVSCKKEYKIESFVPVFFENE
jgi:uncharacterized protein